MVKQFGKFTVWIEEMKTENRWIASYWEGTGQKKIKTLKSRVCPTFKTALKYVQPATGKMIEVKNKPRRIKK